MLALRVAKVIAVSLMLSTAHIVCSQNYPTKPIRIVAPEAGGVSDMTGRMMAQSLAVTLGQQVIIENQGGGSGAIAAQIVARAAPDGHTLLFFGSNVWLLQFFQENLAWDPIRDFSPVTLAVSSPNVLAVHPSLPARSVKELVAIAKARPGDINYASSATGSGNHLAAELFKSMASVDLTRVNYKGTGSAITALVGGEVQMMFATAPNVAPHARSGKLRALAVTSAQPTKLVPGLPTIAASGLPGYEMVTIVGLFTPAGTPPAIIQRLNQEIVRALNKAEIKERLFNAGAEIVGSSPEEFAAAVKSDMASVGKLIKTAGIRAN